MIQVLLLLLAITAIIGTTISSNFQAAFAVDSFNNSVQYKNELMLAKTSVIAASTTFTVTNQIEVDGEIIEQKIVYPALPMGINSNGVNTIPPYLLKTKNVFNREYIYCPFALLEELEYHQAILGQGYSVNTAELTKNNKATTFVMSTPRNAYTDMNVIGFIISPHQKSVAANACNNVSYDNAKGMFISAAGRVEAITRYEVEGMNSN